MTRATTSIAGGAGRVATSRHPRTVGLTAVVIAVLCFSISSSIVKWGDTPGSVVAFWRMFLGVFAWWLLLGAHRARTGAPWPSARTWRLATPPGLLFGANIAIFFIAVTKTSIAHAEFIGAVSPLLLVPAGALLFAEHPNWRALRWGAVSVAGVVVVLAFGPTGGAATVKGDLIMSLAVFSWVGYLVFSKQARASGIGVVDYMACVTPIGVLTAGPIALATAREDLWPLSTRGWLVVLILVALTGLGAHGLVVFAQRSVPIATMGVLQSGQPALAAFWGWLILSEEIRPAQIPGMVLVIFGLAMFTVVSQRRPMPVATDDCPDGRDGDAPA